MTTYNIQLINEISTLVEETCKKDTNIWGYGAWKFHICSVLKYSKLLSEKLNADKEIVEISALLHDFSSVNTSDGYNDHHIKGSKFAEEILTKYNYEKHRIEQVKHCIVAHRASEDIPRETLEAEIIASADAMAHFDNIHDLLYIAYTTHKYDTTNGAKWVLGKISRSWNKLMPEAKELIQHKCDAIKIALENIA